MHKLTSLAVALVASLLLVPDAAAAELKKVGLGVNVGSNVGFEVPINVSGSLRVSPLVSVNQVARTEKPDGGSEVSATMRVLGVGLGVYHLMPTDGPFLMYAGGRVGVLMTNTENFGPDGEVLDKAESSQTDLAVTGVIGAEHFLHPRFSLGAEVALDVALLGDPEGKFDGTAEKDETTGMAVTTGGGVNARFYF